MANEMALGRRTNISMDIAIAVIEVSIVFIMIVPIPGFILDFLLALNLTLAIVIILTAIYIKHVLDFSAFPSLLLIITIFGLGLNISTTRQILLLGPRMEVQLIRVFGDFVVGGNYVVGFIIFLILIIIQFVVISRGATRVSEVAARFRLDATPGKQMAIISDLESGLITQEEAIKRREELNRENEFYGDMDGASKFIQGNIIAAFIINLVNIIGGLIVGVAMRGESLGDAVRTYTLFTVGDGLLSQIPALLTATAMGILVTRATEDEELSKELITQIASVPKVMYISGIMLIVIAILTPLPKIQIIGIGLVFLILGYVTQQSIRRKKEAEEKLELQKKAAAEVKKAPEDVVDLTKVENIVLEFGYSLIPIFDTSQGGTVLERITMLRKTFATNMGLPVPPIRIRDNIANLAPEEYAIKIKDVEVARYAIKTGHLLAINTGMAKEEIEGTDTYDPVYHVPAKWILEKDKEKAEKMGYTVVDPPTIIITHLQAVIKKYASEIFSRAELRKMFENVRKESPSADQLLRGWDNPQQEIYPLGGVHKIFCNLLEEGLPIKDVTTIADIIVDNQNDSPYMLTERVRQKMALTITNIVKHEDGKIYLITIDSELEEMLRGNMNLTRDGYFLELAPDVKQKIVSRFKEAAMSVQAEGYKAVIITDPSIRGLVWQLLKAHIKGLIVVSYNELVEGVDLFSLRTVNLK